MQTLNMRTIVLKRLTIIRFDAPIIIDRFNTSSVWGMFLEFTFLGIIWILVLTFPRGRRSRPKQTATKKPTIASHGGR